MRRMLAAFLVLVSFATPATARDERIRVPHRVPGRHPLTLSANADEWRDRQYEAASEGSLFPDLQRRLDLARAKAPDEEFDYTGGGAVDDLDGDRIGDVLVLRLRGTISNQGSEGSVDLTVRSGRTGAKRWSRHYADALWATLREVKVGRAGAPGLMMTVFTRSGNGLEYDMRVIGIDGRTGKHVYDEEWHSGGASGEVQWGGLFDAYIRGGTDLLIGRVRKVTSVVGTGLQLFEVQPFALDGATGAVRALRDSALVVASGYAYLAVGDVNGDTRDDFLGLRRLVNGKGEVTAYGVFENEVHWTVDGILMGYFIRSGGNADVVGDKHEDVLFMTWVYQPGLLEIPPLTDGLPLLDGPPDGIHGVLLDGSTGELQWDRLDGKNGSYAVWDDVNRDRKADVLVVAMFQGARDGMSVLVVTGGNKVVRKREISVEAPIARRYTGVGFANAGDLDGDGVVDLTFSVFSASDLQFAYKRGFVLVGAGRAVESRDYAFGGTLDGGSAERIVVKRNTDEDTATLVVADGWRGAPLWTITASAHKAWFWVGVHPGARGACDGMMVYGGGEHSTWLYALDATGRVKWSLTMMGKRPEVSLKVSGRMPRCRR